jgi:hypothetical protein
MIAAESTSESLVIANLIAPTISLMSIGFMNNDDSPSFAHSDPQELMLSIGKQPVAIDSLSEPEKPSDNETDIDNRDSPNIFKTALCVNECFLWQTIFSPLARANLLECHMVFRLAE